MVNLQTGLSLARWQQLTRKNVASTQATLSATYASLNGALKALPRMWYVLMFQ